VFFPVGDDNSRRTRVPYVTLGLVALNVIVFLAELFANSQGGLEALVRQWSVIPADYARGAGIGGPMPWTIVTSMFLHGGWMHLIGNLVYLGIFGDNVESALGHLQYLAFYLLTGALGSIAHILTAPGSTVPSLGASGAISGVLAAYLVLFPHNRVHVLIWFQVRQVPAILVIGLWAIFQFITGAGSLLSPREGGGVAYLAHVGGFVAGLLLLPLFRLLRRGPAELPPGMS
jgi:membrane associated rhomboid family serine protease